MAITTFNFDVILRYPSRYLSKPRDALSRKFRTGCLISGPHQFDVYRFCSRVSRRYVRLVLAVAMPSSPCGWNASNGRPAVSGSSRKSYPLGRTLEKLQNSCRESCWRNNCLRTKPEPILAAINANAEAGFDHVHLHQVGPDQHDLIELAKSRYLTRNPSSVIEHTP
jgi:hypothetical protein